ncbi:hypothetical protein AOLI_G00316610 [Acnodon oligacanthus]
MGSFYRKDAVVLGSWQKQSYQQTPSCPASTCSHELLGNSVGIVTAGPCQPCLSHASPLDPIHTPAIFSQSGGERQRKLGVGRGERTERMSKCGKGTGQRDCVEMWKQLAISKGKRGV